MLPQYRNPVAPNDASPTSCLVRPSGVKSSPGGDENDGAGLAIDERFDMRARRHRAAGRPPLDSVSTARRARLGEPPIGIGGARRARDHARLANAPQDRRAVAPQRPSACEPFDGPWVVLERRQVGDDIGLDRLGCTDHSAYRERHANVSRQDSARTPGAGRGRRTRRVTTPRGLPMPPIPPLPGWRRPPGARVARESR